MNGPSLAGAGHAAARSGARVSSDRWGAPRSARPLRFAGGAFVVALHGVAVFALLQVGAVRETLREAAPIVVRLLEPEPPAPPPRAPAPPPRAAQPPKKPNPPRLVTAPPAPAPVAFVAPTAPVEVQPEPDQPVEPVPTPAPVVTAPPAPVAAPAPAPEPVVPPRFDAAYLDNPAPVYPPIARRMGEQGKVLLRVFVGTDGRAERVDVNRTSGSARLDQAAAEAVRRWRFVPARQGDSAVAAWVIVPINFSMEG